MSNKARNTKKEEQRIPPVSSDIVACVLPADKMNSELVSAHPGDCAVNALVSSEMEGVDSTELEKRPPPGKLSIIYSHGSTIVNEYFVVPKGYYFYFDTVKSEASYTVRSGSSEYVDKETGYKFPIDALDLAALQPETRHLAIDHADFIHQYAPGDVMTNHLISFYPGKANTSLSEAEFDRDGEMKFITGIVLPDVAIDPMDLVYTNGKLRNTYLQVLGPDNPGLIKFNEITTLYDLINIGIELTNGDIYKLPPGHIVLRSCRKLVYSSDTEFYSVTREKYNNMDYQSQVLMRQMSTGHSNANITARNPSGEQHQFGEYEPELLFRPPTITGNMQIAPLSSKLVKPAKNTVGKKTKKNKQNNKEHAASALHVSRVYVTTYVRQGFAAKIRYYNTSVLSRYEAEGLIPKPEFEDMYPMDSSTGKYVRIDPFGVLTPQQVYAVMMATSCHVCARNLARLPNSHLCARCHVVGFCDKHFGGSSRLTKHECFKPFIKGK